MSTTMLETYRGILETYYKTRFCALSWLITKIIYMQLRIGENIWRRDNFINNEFLFPFVCFLHYILCNQQTADFLKTHGRWQDHESVTVQTSVQYSFWYTIMISAEKLSIRGVIHDVPFLELFLVSQCCYSCEKWKIWQQI